MTPTLGLAPQPVGAGTFAAVDRPDGLPAPRPPHGPVPEVPPRWNSRDSGVTEAVKIPVPAADGGHRLSRWAQ